MSNIKSISLTRAINNLRDLADKAAAIFKQTGKLVKLGLTAGTVIEGKTCGYIVQPSGSWVRLNPKPYRNKAEMKRQKRERRLARFITAN